MPDVKEPTEVAPPPSAPKKSLIPANLAAMLTKAAIFGVIGLVAILAAFMITTKVLKPMLARSSATVEQKVEPPPAPVEKKVEAKAEESKKPEKSEGGREEGETGGAAESNYYNIESIVVNPAGTGGTRYLSCGISFEMGSAEDVKIFEGKAAQVKDVLITILSSKTVDELADIRQRNQMRRQILMIVNRFLAPAQAKAVYLTDFVLQ